MTSSSSRTKLQLKASISCCMWLATSSSPANYISTYKRITGVISCADVGTRRGSTAHAARVMAWRRKVEDAIFQTSYSTCKNSVVGGRWRTRGSSLCSNHQKRLCTVLQATPRPKTPHRETQSALPPLSSSSFSHREIILKQNKVDWCSTFYASIELYIGQPCPGSGPFVLN
jgi:hypothetical protein